MPYPRVYREILIINWLAFGCDIISLGMTTLFCQIFAIALLIDATTLKIYQIEDEEHRIEFRLNLDLKVVEH
jgi:TctA family transporter